eukprot:2487492-Amphidinium_carterae.1
MTLLGSKERQSGARVLSEELLKRENKAKRSVRLRFFGDMGLGAARKRSCSVLTARFKARREALHAQACKEHEDMQAKLAAADVRWAQRREQLNSEQRPVSCHDTRTASNHQKRLAWR